MFSCFLFFQHAPIKGITFVKTSGKIVNPIDLEQIERKAEQYTSFCEFKTDTEWFIHNCEIMYPTVEKIKNAIESLRRFIDDEIESIIDCTQCFGNTCSDSDDSFVITCTPVHPIIWARSSGFGFWPAKFMRFDGGKVRVRYFGDHLSDVVQLKNCYKYSEKLPSKATALTPNADSRALEVKSFY